MNSGLKRNDGKFAAPQLSGLSPNTDLRGRLRRRAVACSAVQE